MMIRKHFAVSAIMLAVALVLSGCHTGSEKHTSAVSQQSGSNASATQSSSSSLSSASSAGPSSKPVDSSTGSSQPSDLLKVQSTVQKTMPIMDYIVGWVNKDTILYSDLTNNVSTLRTYAPQTGTDSAFILPKGENIYDPAISPDGAYLAFAATDTSSQANMYDLRVMNLKTKVVKTLYEGVNDLEWASKDHLIITISDKSSSGPVPYLIDLSGKWISLRNKIAWSGANTYQYGSIISNQLFYLERKIKQPPSDLYALDLTTGIRELLGKNVDCFYDAPNNRYAFAEVTTDETHTVFEIINLQGKVERVLQNNTTKEGYGVASNVTWSPDGKYIAYAVIAGGGKDSGLYLYDTTRNLSVKIENNIYGSDYVPYIFWNPTESSIAFCTREFSNNVTKEVFKIFSIKSE